MRVEPPQGWTLVALVAALCFLAGVTGWRLNEDDRPGSGSADVGFLFDMVAHHQQATTMARTQLADGTRGEVAHIAEEIDRFQSYEIGVMARMLEEWGYFIETPRGSVMGWMGDAVPLSAMPGLASEAEIERLRDAGTGAETDALFVALMIDHHAGAVGMAEAAADRADDEDVVELARRIAKSQRFEIRELIALATRRDLDLTPAGMSYEVYDPVTRRILDHDHRG